jgi:hypothetical protein
VAEFNGVATVGYQNDINEKITELNSGIVAAIIFRIFCFAIGVKM